MFRFACEHCGRQIEARSDDAQRSIHCPGCLKPVTVPGSGSVSSGSGRSPSSAAPSGGGGLGVLIAGVLVLLLAGGGAVGVWYLLNKKPDDKPGPDAKGSHVEADGPEIPAGRLLPGNAQMVATIRSAELYRLQAARDALEQSRKRNPKQVDPAAQIERDVGLKPDEVELLHAVGVDADKQLAWVVVKTLAPIDRPKVLGKISDSSEKHHQGRRYYLGKNPVGDEIAVHVAGPQVLVVSGEQGMKLALEQAAKPEVEGPLKPTIGMMETSKSQVIVGLNPAGGGTKALEGNALFKDFVAAEWVRVVLDANEEKATLNLTAKAKDKAGAESMKKSASIVLAGLALKALALKFGGTDDQKVGSALEKFGKATQVEVKDEEVRMTATTDPATMAVVMAYLTEEVMKQLAAK